MEKALVVESVHGSNLIWWRIGSCQGFLYGRKRRERRGKTASLPVGGWLAAGSCDECRRAVRARESRGGGPGEEGGRAEPDISGASTKTRPRSHVDEFEPARFSRRRSPFRNPPRRMASPRRNSPRAEDEFGLHSFRRLPFEIQRRSTALAGPGRVRRSPPSIEGSPPRGCRPRRNPRA